MRRPVAAFTLVLALLCFYSLAFAQNSKHAPSTPEDRQRFVTIAHKMEEAPLDESLRSDREWAFRWLIEVPDLTVSMCTAPLGNFMKKKYKYSPEIVTQLTFSSGAFLIEHPDKASDLTAQYLAGVEGALKAYQSILKSKPEARSKELDGLLQTQTEGKLPEFVRDTSSKGCTSKKQASRDISPMETSHA